MKENNLIPDKTFSFGLRNIKLHRYKKKNNVDRRLRLQFLKSGTSIGADAEKGMGRSSKKDFKQKLRISYTEARETDIGFDYSNRVNCLKHILLIQSFRTAKNFWHPNFNNNSTSDYRLIINF